MPRPANFCIDQLPNDDLHVCLLNDVPPEGRIVFGHYGLARHFAQAVRGLMEGRGRAGRVGRPVTVGFSDGTTRKFGSILECSKSLKISRNLIYRNIGVTSEKGLSFNCPYRLRP